MANQTDDLPATLRAIRATLNLTQEQLAERLGVSFATVNRWEGGNSKPQKAAREAIAALADEAGVEPEEAAGSAPMPKRGRKKGASQSPTTKPMEQMLWDSACSIRGEKDAAKFKDFLLPLLFLKRLSDVFDDEVDRLAEEYDDRETALQIADADHSLLRFYLPPEARWAAISGREEFAWPVKDKPRDIGEHLTKAMRAVVKHNPTLSGVIDVVDFAAERNGERDINPAKLRDVVETFSDPRYRLGLADVDPDFLGRAYEYLLRKFAEGSGQSAGEFFTPTNVGFLMAYLLKPRPGQECHDYACGSAGLLIKLQLVARDLDPTSKVPLKLTGQELQAESYAVARMNAIIHDMDVELQRGDTMINPKFRTADGRVRSYDLVVANPMWNQPFSTETFTNDAFDRFRGAGGVTTGRGDWAWLQHTLACMNDNGRAAVVLDTGAVTRGSGSKNEDKERNIRKWFVEHDLIEGVILLPENLFYNTTAAGVIVVLNKRKPKGRQGKIVLVNASKRFEKGRPKNYLPDDVPEVVAGLFNRGEAVEGEVAIIEKSQAEEFDYNLMPSRWVGFNDANDHRSLHDLLRDIDAATDRLGSAKKALLAALANSPADRESDEPLEVSYLNQKWSWSAIEDLFEIAPGKTMSRAAREGDNKVPFLRTSNVLWDEISLDKVDEMAIPPKELETKSVERGDLLVCEGGEIGRAAVWDLEVAPMSFQNHLHRLRPKRDDVIPRFYVYFLHSAFTQLGLFEGAGNKTTIANLSRSRLAALEVPRPERDEQLRIVNLLGLIREAIQGHRRTERLLSELYESILYRIMTGQLDIDELDTSALSDAAGDMQ